MKEPPSFHHMLQLVRYYWRTEKHLYLRLFLSLVAVYVFKSLLFWIIGRFFSVSQMSGIFILFNDEWIFWGFILVCMAHMFSSLSSKQRATIWLALPASNLEKFLSRVVFATLGIWLLAFAARVTANFISVIPIFFDTLVMNGNLSLSQIFLRFVLPGTWSVFSVGIVGFFHHVAGTAIIALWPWSLFTLCGVFFRRNGWLWAVPMFFVGVFVLYLFLEKVLGTAWAHDHDVLFDVLFAAILLLPSAFNYWLCYRCFRRAQVVTPKLTRL